MCPQAEVTSLQHDLAACSTQHNERSALLESHKTELSGLKSELSASRAQAAKLQEELKQARWAFLYFFHSFFRLGGESVVVVVVVAGVGAAGCQTAGEAAAH